MSLTHEVVKPTLDRLHVHYVHDADRNMVLASFTIDGARGGRSVVMVVPNDEGHDLHIWAGYCEVPASRKVAVLQVLNELNSTRRFLKWSITQDLVTVETDAELSFSSDPQGHFALAYCSLVEALHVYWPRIVRAATQGKTRSRVDREVAAILDQLSQRETGESTE
jgi:hypothetical protein